MKKTSLYVGKRVRRRRKKKNYRPLFITLVLFIILYLLFILGNKWFSADILPDADIQYVGNIPVYEDIIPSEAAGRVLEKREIKYIVIHETANTSAGADAEAHNRFIHQNSMTEEHSWHYTVDDKQIYHHVPDDEPAYHAGDQMERNGGNLNGIGIEMCVASDNDYDATVDNTAQLSARLLLEYDLDPQTALKKPQDFSGKLCPQIMLEQDRWEDFVKLVCKYYEMLQQTDT